jgi:hypothetical protein
MILTYAPSNNVTINSLSGIGNTNKPTAIASSIPGVNNGTAILLFDSDHVTFSPSANSTTPPGSSSSPQLTSFEGATITAATFAQTTTTPPGGSGDNSVTGTLTLTVSGGTSGTYKYTLVNLNPMRGTPKDPCLDVFAPIPGNGYFCKNIYQYYFVRTP